MFLIKYRFKISFFFEHSDEKGSNSTLCMGKASPGKSCLGVECGKEFARWVGEVWPSQADENACVDKSHRSFKKSQAKEMMLNHYCKFNPCFLVKNLAVEFQIMVFQLANKILHLALLLIWHTFYCKVASPGWWTLSSVVSTEAHPHPLICWSRGFIASYIWVWTRDKHFGPVAGFRPCLGT